ncbi:hypothetical protein [Sulfitobacter guttiformis]|uniref:Dihydrodipicolinate reductase n=1 Tax=Sulfitobacter guttiformis TaxID=74349 RepID=A0A420DT40_9RHOB|nr:hypothetical protein [Sulfitobacter guttiformis]KIN74758.1 Dihydrodipicolinate reductase [Sulfitobacter guttiformis KCTC 32187]RKE97330.1 hypothetical protein C8N30_1928 [Sulfitobacter guttiformis]
MKPLLSILAALAFIAATPAVAELAKIETASEFKTLIGGKTLTRPLIKMAVSTGGAIEGQGAAWPISGSWTWKDGFFCRSLEWGGDDLGYNCMEVKASGSKIRFTADQGAGDSADFSLR